MNRQKKIYEWQRSTRKDIEHHCSLRTCKFKSWKGNTRHLLECLKTELNKTKQYRVLIKLWSNRNSHTSLVVIQNGMVTLEMFGGFLMKLKYTYHIHPKSPIPKKLLKRNENLCLHKNLNMNIYKGYIITQNKTERKWSRLAVPDSCVAHQAPPSMGFSRQDNWSGLLFPSPGDSSQPRDWTQVSCIADRRFTIWATREAHIITQSGDNSNIHLVNGQTVVAYPHSGRLWLIHTAQMNLRCIK